MHFLFHLTWKMSYKYNCWNANCASVKSDFEQCEGGNICLIFRSAITNGSDAELIRQIYYISAWKRLIFNFDEWFRACLVDSIEKAGYFHYFCSYGWVTQSGNTGSELKAESVKMSNFPKQLNPQDFYIFGKFSINLDTSNLWPTLYEHVSRLFKFKWV